MDAKQLEKMMGLLPRAKKAAEAYEKMSGRKVAPSSWEGHQSPMSRASLYQHVGESILLRRLTKAKRHGQTRTERLRELITLDALIAQARSPSDRT